ncbi:FAR1 DNA binding domain, zinc finger, SWIM-type, MULE transposase domain containing protein [Tanacetum coccineum]
MMIRKVDGDMFEVYGFVEEHNNPLVSQDDMQFMMSSRELGFLKQQFMLQVANSNVGLVRAFKLMKEMYCGFENVGMTATYCKNFRPDLNLFIGDQDAQMVVEKLENLKKRCEGFFMDYCQGKGDTLCGLFWADKVAKLNYQRFGDTISFDATFRYRMVFVPFTGIDNHSRSVTFGAGLLSDEIVRSYKWLLQSFKKVGSSLEKEAAELFTLNIFYEIQDEILASNAKCLSVNVERMGRFEKCYIRDTEVKKWEDSTQFEVYEVLYSSSDTILTCSCRQYELYGLLYRHILYVDTSAFACESSSSAGICVIRRIVEDTVDRLVPFKDKLDLYRLELSDLLAKAEAEVLVLMRVNKKDTFCSMLGVTEPESVVIKVPRHSTNKGIGSHTRWKNMDELIQNEAETSKKRRTCFVCRRAEGYNCRTCPYKAAINVAAAANKRTKCTTRSSALKYKE